MSRVHWEALAAFFNAAEITPQGNAASDPALPRSMYSYDGIHGIAYKYNGGSPGWFPVSGPNDTSDDFYTPHVRTPE